MNIHSHRQPVAHAADVARGILPLQVIRDERTGGGGPVVPAGSLAKVGGFVAATMCSAGSMLMFGWGYAVPGIVYGAIAAGGAVLFLLEAYRETRDEAKAEADRLERIAVAKRRAQESFERIEKRQKLREGLGDLIAKVLKAQGAT